MAHMFRTNCHASIYRRFRPKVPKEVVDTILQFMGARRYQNSSVAVDVGCGSGQLTEGLSSYFETVHGFDISAAQIAEAQVANRARNVLYSVSPAEDLPVTTSTVDLTTAATAAHWFEFTLFIQEVERVLKPGGCLAIISNHDIIRIRHRDASVENMLHDCLQKFWKNIAPYWDITVEKIDAFYGNFTVFFGDVERAVIAHTTQMSVGDVCDFYSTLSQVAKIHKERPDLDVIGDLRKSLSTILGIGEDDASEMKMDVTWTWRICLAQKPCDQ